MYTPDQQSLDIIKKINELLSQIPTTLPGHQDGMINIQTHLLAFEDAIMNHSEEGAVFIVWGHSGRYNGHAVVKAHNKLHAQNIAESDWLDEGVVDRIETLQEYKEDYFDVLEDEEEDQYKAIKLGQIAEIEWGS